MSEPTTSNIMYFIGGALLPTLTYFLLWRYFEKSDAKYFEELNNDDDEALDDSEFSNTPVDSNPKKWGFKHAPYKMVLIVNKELKMGKGKIAAQCSHAAVGCYKASLEISPNGTNAWEYTGCAKIAVLCPTEEELLKEILPKVKAKKMSHYLVEDAGRTQIAAGSRTVLGLGPAPVYMFEGISDHLKLM